MRTPPLIASCWITAGDAAPGRGDERSPHGLAARVEAAAAAGFTGFGLLHADIEPARRELGYDGMRELFAAHGIERVELEVLGDYWCTGPAREASDAIRRDLLEAAEALGAHNLKTLAPAGDGAWDLDTCARETARLAAEFERVGTRVSFEFLPVCSVKTVAEGRMIVEAADHPNVGLLVDSWHVFRGDSSLDEVAALPAELIAAVEIDDAAAEPVGSLWDDTIDRRLPPGWGDLDLAGFIAAIEATGWKGPWGVEVLSAELRRRPLAEAVADVYAATVATFAAVS